MTLTRGVPIATGLLDWVLRPSPDRALRFLQDDGEWRGFGYGELAERVRRVAGLLRAQGLQRNEVVVLVHRTGPEFVASFFGVLMAGGTVSPLTPPLGLGSAADWTGHAAHAIGAADAKIVLADADLTDAVVQAAPDCRVIVVDDEADIDTDALAVPEAPADIALLQFTSGSRGPTRGVRVTWENLEANVDMIKQWIRCEGGVTAASWLPLYHDMGLIGAMIVPITGQWDHGLARPEQFVQTPLRWLAEFGSRDGAMMVMPNFGFDYVVRRVPPHKLEGMDFSSVKVVVTGAERVRPASLMAFSRLLEPFGFDPAAFQPAYGLAEATLAVTGVAFDEVPTIVAVAPGPVRIGFPIEIVATGTLTDFADDTDDPALWHVSCGRPLAGTSVEIVDDLGGPLPEGYAGEIAISGPAVAKGYVREDREASTRFEDGRLYTGDAGFLLDGELYVLGRIGDSLPVRGRNLYVEDLEQALAEEGLFSWHRMVVLAGYLDDVPTICLLSEVPLPEAEALAVLTAIAGSGIAVRIMRVPRRTIQVTSSGKPRRRLMWQKVLAQEVPVTSLQREER